MFRWAKSRMEVWRCGEDEDQKEMVFIEPI
jgi:hypothetical protein